MPAIAQRACTFNYDDFHVSNGAEVLNVYFIQSKLLDLRLLKKQKKNSHPLKTGGTLKIINGSLIIRPPFFLKMIALTQEKCFLRKQKKAEYCAH